MEILEQLKQKALAWQAEAKQWEENIKTHETSATMKAYADGEISRLECCAEELEWIIAHYENK